jgi:hypothetical protein
MQNALCQHFTGLAGRDDYVLEDANGPVSCRLLVRRCINLILPKNGRLKFVRPLTSSPGILSIGAIKCDSDLIRFLPIIDVFPDRGEKLEKGAWSYHEE